MYVSLRWTCGMCFTALVESHLCLSWSSEYWLLFTSVGGGNVIVDVAKRGLWSSNHSQTVSSSIIFFRIWRHDWQTCLTNGRFFGGQTTPASEHRLKKETLLCKDGHWDLSMVDDCVHHKAPQYLTDYCIPNLMWPVDDIFILPGVIISLCLDTVLARMGIEHLLLPVQLPGTHWAMICVIRRLALTVSDVCS